MVSHNKCWDVKEGSGEVFVDLGALLVDLGVCEVGATFPESFKISYCFDGSAQKPESNPSAPKGQNNRVKKEID